MLNFIEKKNKRKFHRSGLLKLNSNKAKDKLKWSCKLSFKKTIELVTNWYREYCNKKDKKIITISQVILYETFKKKSHQIVL